jgi:translation initiation factor 1A
MIASKLTLPVILLFEQARNLQAFGELPVSARINQTAVDMAMDADGDENDDGFDFEEI